MSTKNIMNKYLSNPEQIKLARPMLVSLMLGISLSMIQNTANAGNNGIVGSTMTPYDMKKPESGVSKKAQQGITANQSDTLKGKVTPRTNQATQGGQTTTKPTDGNGLKATTPKLTNKKLTPSTKGGSPYTSKNRNYAPGTPLGTTRSNKSSLQNKSTATTLRKAPQTTSGNTRLQPYQPVPSTGLYSGQKQFDSGSINRLSRPNTPQPQMLPQNTMRTTGMVRNSPSSISCPDPAVVRIVAGWPSRNTNGTYNFRLFAVVRNVGQETYNSQRNQQQITLRQGNRVLKTSTWSRSVVPPGASGEVASEFYDVRNWNPNPGEFAADFSAQIIYAPDIRVDGNPLNDDCRNSNNRNVLTVAELRRTLGELR